MAFEGWETDENGGIKVFPFTGLETFVPVGTMCGARLAYVTNPAMLASGDRLHLPLVMSPTQARDLATRLIQLADTAEQSTTTPGTMQ